MMMNYEDFLELLKYRRSIRRFKSDPIPDEYITKILDAAHYAMSGANSQPWEFIVVKDPEIKKRLFNVFLEDIEECWNLEQQRIPQYRQPAFNEEKDKTIAMIGGWKDAPVCIAILEDFRKQFGSVMATFDPHVAPVLSTTMGHVSMVIHLAAASLGLGSQRVDAGKQELYREILGYPEPVRLNHIIPVGYRAYEPGPPHRFPVKKLTHYDKYDMSKYLRDEDFLKYIDSIRALGKPGYRVAMGEGKG